MLGVRGRKVDIYTDPNLVTPLIGSPTDLNTKTLYVTPRGDNSCKATPRNITSPVCHFANVEFDGRKGTLLLENPRGDVCSVEQLLAQVSLSIPI